MKKSGIVFAMMLAAAGSFGQAPAGGNPPRLGTASVKDVVSAMTTEEKVRLVVGMGFRMPGAPRRDSTRQAPVPPMSSMDSADQRMPIKVPGSAGRTHAIPRLGIPSITVSDGPAGVRISPYRNGDSSRSYFATAFPVATLLASSWDTALVRRVGEAFGREVHEYGIDVLLAPGMNIHRNPLGGRNFEYYSEDPLVSGYICAALVNGIQSNGVGTSIKHFAANNQETNRNSVNTILSERALREIYLKGFEIAIRQSNPWTVMTSYNKINGVYTSESPELLTDILRKEWGYRGMVMTDWFGGKDPVAQMNAGNDLLMPGTPAQSKAILDAIGAGRVDMKTLDANVTRILNLILQSPEFRKYKYSDKPDLARSARIARQAAAESMVLLKNQDGVLPLRHSVQVAVFGNTSYDPIAGGTGSGDVNKAYSISLQQGLTDAGFVTDENLKTQYQQYIATAKAARPAQRNFFALPPPIPEMAIGDDVLAGLASRADLAILTFGRNAGEGRDRKQENDFTLSDQERALLTQVANAFHAKKKPLVVVLNIGGVVEVASWRGLPDAILLAWQPGEEGGHAIADILSGKVNPSGKLATSFPMQYSDVPSAKNFPGRELPGDTTRSTGPGFGGRPSEVTYEEGIYVGYRYYHSFHVKTAYDFGYGLSYTRFRYGPISLSSSTFNGTLTAKLTVTNTGKVAGKEIVQWYVSAPSGKLEKPVEELRGFVKTKLLQPGQSQTVSLTLRPADLASYDTPMSSWVAEAGDYTLKAGASSSDIRQQANFHLSKEIVTEKDAHELAPKTQIRELSRETSAFIYELNNFAILSR